MDNKTFATIIADIHNKLLEVSVRGDDVFRMAEVLQRCRTVATNLTQTNEGTEKSLTE